MRLIFRVQGKTQAEVEERAQRTINEFATDLTGAVVDIECRPLVESFDQDVPAMWEGTADVRLNDE